MGLFWGIVRTIVFGFGLIVALLIAIDGALLSNLLRKNS